MILDSQLAFSEAQAVTTTAASTNQIDLVNARDMGPGYPLKVLCLVTTAFTSNGTQASTLTIGLEGSTNSTSSNMTEIVRSPAYLSATLVDKAKVFAIDVPALPTGQAFPRYLRLNYTVGVAAFSTGALSAYILLDRDDNAIYPKNYSAAYPLA